MSEETKEPLEETPVTAETAETEQEKTPENQEPEKKAKKKEKKEKGITFTREQVEKMELAVKQLESWRCMTIWSGPQPPRAARTIPTKRDWR